MFEGGNTLKGEVVSATTRLHAGFHLALVGFAAARCMVLSPATEA